MFRVWPNKLSWNRTCFFAPSLVAISKQLFKCQSKLLLNFRPLLFFPSLDISFFDIESSDFCADLIKCETYWNSILQEWKFKCSLKIQFSAVSLCRTVFSRRWPIFLSFFCDTLGCKSRCASILSAYTVKHDLLKVKHE